MNSEEEFAQKIVAATANIGTLQTLKLLGKAMCYIASEQGYSIQLELDIGTVKVEPKIKPRHIKMEGNFV